MQKKVTNPVILSEDLEVGYKYIFFVTKKKSEKNENEIEDSKNFIRDRGEEGKR